MTKLSIFIAALVLQYAASTQVGGTDCPETCYGVSCVAAATIWYGPDDGCATLESWGCDCDGCACDDYLDIDTLDIPDDYACGATDMGGHTCDELAYAGWNCHYLETRKGADCTGCLCEEAIHGYEKGDGTCPHSCVGTTCDGMGAEYGLSCEHLESNDSMAGCDCSGCGCDAYEESLSATYGHTDCNGNIYPYGGTGLGDETCEDDLTPWTMLASAHNEEYTWFGCLNCPELECDGGDCGDSCGRGETCALPLNELCADEGSVVSPTQLGRGFYCPEGWDATEEGTEVATEEASEATVAAEEDGSLVLSTTAVFAIVIALAQ